MCIEAIPDPVSKQRRLFLSNSRTCNLIAATLAAFLLSGCHNTPATNIQISGHGTDKPDPICDNFRMTPAQVKTFFDRAHPIAAEQLHEFDYLPCWVEVLTTDAGGTSKWRIHPVGIARVTHPDGKTEI